ncbi:MAG TPA: hypothetical protein VFB72_09715 [Verrucomicrobiae bacterium]|nr:hypothetical protein [Verrucomicrobiae bacterium]
MIVYGDPQFEAGSSELLEQLRERAFAASAEDLDQLRSLLIRAGELEQALEDAGAEQAATCARKITDSAAAAFHDVWAQCQLNRSIPRLDVRANLNELRNFLSNTFDFPSQVTVKIPEGFAFYALYPEQYCEAALAWSDCNGKDSNDRKVLVVGIRSIGTTLSALVSATLAVAGWQTKRISVRPTGPPFERATSLPEHVRGSAARALVVDEGPGISGSSMASVAEALVQQGFAPEQISFLPGHSGEPGTAASSEVQDWWRRARRYVASWNELRWNGMTLAESVKTKSAEIAGGRTNFSKVEDLSCGRWREKIFAERSAWPWAPISFERMKFLCTNEDGCSILWKFSGLRECQTPKEAKVTTEGTVPPLALFRGFIALPWIEGEPLSIDDGKKPDVVRQIARYIKAASKTPLTASEQAGAFERIHEMLYWNTKEALGADFAERVNGFAKTIRIDESGPAYGDGRLAPHEWMRTREGKIVKLDSFGHDADHTMVGPQPIYWDVAGAIVEWQLPSAQPLLSELEQAGIFLRPEVLSFYQMAYAAFRMGQSALCVDAWAFDEVEVERTREAFERYRQQLRDCLESADIRYSSQALLTQNR